MEAMHQGFNARRLKRDRHLSAGLVATCRRKVRHNTFAQAEAARALKPLPDVYNSYECRRCHGYHIGHLMVRRIGRRP
jgi:hypothetical protein